MELCEGHAEVGSTKELEVSCVSTVQKVDIVDHVKNPRQLVSERINALLSSKYNLKSKIKMTGYMYRCYENDFLGIKEINHRVKIYRFNIFLS